MESKLYNQEGKEVGTVALPGAVFGVPRNNVLLRQVILAMKANARQSSAHTKNRSEVSGGGKKPWRQKGTGRARHGSSRSPLWRS
ncbi:MAG: 50S ribosomal protein L4, partial [Candidatus Lloydbacteria bacterium RIFCSPLOWO2_02_FULL_51_11]